MPADKHHPADEPLLPGLATPEWDGMGEEADAIDPDDVEVIDELTGGGEADEETSDDDDDNPYQDSDDALPDDEEEAAISEDLSREGDERLHDS